MKQHIIQWTAPSPLWPELTAAGRSANFGAPAILRFATDNFMQEFFDTLATDPRKLGEFRAVPETWRGRQLSPVVPTPARIFALPFQRLGRTQRRPAATGTKIVASADTAALPRLKLYQPAHQRFYLVSACLVCESPGLPDRKIDAARQERTGFLLRRLLPPDGVATVPADVTQWDEYAWLKTATGFIWHKVLADGRTENTEIVPGEERLPLFPTTHQEDDHRTRRLVSGNIPVAKREVYLGAQRRTAKPNPATDQGLPPGTTVKTARKILLRKQVIEPWRALVAQAATMKNNLDSTPPVAPLTNAKAYRASREQVQLVSWLILLDLAEFLATYIPALWNAVITGNRPNAADTNLVAAYDIIDQATLQSTLRTNLCSDVNDVGAGSAPIYLIGQVPQTLREALAKYGNQDLTINATLKAKLETNDGPYVYSRAPLKSVQRTPWPDFIFPLADVERPGDAPLSADIPLFDLNPAEIADLDQGGTGEPLDEFTAALIRAMPENTTQPQPEISPAALPAADQLNGVFRIRCVYERPACGPLHDDVVSDPSEPFDLAGFFDPDAPARPIRIGLPIDTTPAGLRKFDKNTAFVMSDILCGQVNRMKKITFGDLVMSILPWPFHRDLDPADKGPCANMGMICSLSIPIITLCALILLIIMVALLDFVFKWMPFLICCFPIPGLKARK